MNKSKHLPYLFIYKSWLVHSQVITLWQHRETSESRLAGQVCQGFFFRVKASQTLHRFRFLLFLFFVLSSWLVGLCLLFALDSGFDFLGYGFQDTRMEWMVAKKSRYWPHFNYYYMISIFAPPSVSWGDSLRVVPKPHCSQSWGMPVMFSV